MRPARFGLSTLAALLIGAFVAGAGGSAAQAAAAPPKPPEITKEQRDAGMKAAPALVQAASLPCTLADARMIGATPARSEDQGGLDLLRGRLQGPDGLHPGRSRQGGQTPSWAACPDQAKVDPVTGKPNGAACFLPANMDDKAQLAPFVAKRRRALRRDERARHRPLAEVGLLRSRLHQRPRLRADHVVAARSHPEGADDQLPGVRRVEPGGLQADQRTTRSSR